MAPTRWPGVNGAKTMFLSMPWSIQSRSLSEGSWVSNHIHVVQNPPDVYSVSCCGFHNLYHGNCLAFELSQLPPAVIETPCTLHEVDCISLDPVIGGFLLQYINQLQILWIWSYAMNNGEGKFPFCEIFAEPLVGCVFGTWEIHVIVTYLEKSTY